MGFSKAFGFSMLAFIGLNVGFFFLGYGIDGLLIAYFQALAINPLNIFAMFFGPIITGQFPFLMTSTFTSWVTGGPFFLGSMFLFIGYIVAPLVAAFLSGRFGEDKLQDFMGWFATVMICALVVLIGGVIELVMVAAPPPFIVAQVLGSIAIGLVYGLAYGSISLLTSREF